MNGPEHYREAERLTAKAFDGDTMFTPDVRARLLYGAQVHATLALAAAQALPTVTQFMGDSDLVTAWAHSIGWTKSSEQVEATIYCGKPVGDGECGEPEGHGGDCKNKWECPF